MNDNKLIDIKSNVKTINSEEHQEFFGGRVRRGLRMVMLHSMKDFKRADNLNIMHTMCFTGGNANIVKPSIQISIIVVNGIRYKDLNQKA